MGGLLSLLGYQAAVSAGRFMTKDKRALTQQELQVLAAKFQKDLTDLQKDGYEVGPNAGELRSIRLKDANRDLTDLTDGNFTDVRSAGSKAQVDKEIDNYHDNNKEVPGKE